MSAKTAIDLEHLARYTGGDANLNAEILQLFDGQTVMLVARLRAILDARDTKSWKEVIHSIKGAARGVGAFDLADAAVQCEKIDLADTVGAGQAIDLVNSRAEAVQAFVKTQFRR